MASRSKTSDSKAVSAFSLLMMPRSGNYPTFSVRRLSVHARPRDKRRHPRPGAVKRGE